MRIGLFTDSYPPYINGVSTSVAMLKSALEKLGHEVYLVTISDNALKYELEEDGHIIRVPGIPIGIYDYRLSRIYPISMINTMKNWHLDVIHSHTEFGIGIFARLFAKQFGIPLVHTYHTMYEDYTHYITHGYFDKSSKKIVEYLTKFYCDKTATELIVPTDKIYKLFKEKYEFEKNINIIPTGIEVERFYKENINQKEVARLRRKLGLSKKDYVLLFVGRLAEEKNVEFLLNVAEKLVKKNKVYKLLIVGSGPDEEKFANIAKEKGIEDNVIFTGKVPWEEVPYYYHLADLFLSASTTETQGLTIVEAMASGVSPICIKDEAFLSTITDGLNGRIFENEEQLEKIITHLYKYPNTKQKMDRQARIKAELCSSKYYAESVLVVYERAIIEKQNNKRLLSRVLDKIKGENYDNNA